MANVASFFGKSVGFLKGGLRTVIGEAGHNSAKTQLLLQAGFAGLTLLGHSSPHDKMKKIGEQALFFWLTAGMNSGIRQVIWSVGLTMTPMFPSIFRGMAHGYRAGMEARSSAAIPFSHSTMPMDSAFASLQYAQSRVNEAYSGLGSEAAMFSSRFLSRQ